MSSVTFAVTELPSHLKIFLSPTFHTTYPSPRSAEATYPVQPAPLHIVILIMANRASRRAALRKAAELARQASSLNQKSPLIENITKQQQPAMAAPISEARLAANRANAKLSTGPSPAGRATSCQNHTIHGLARHNGVFKLLGSEDPAGFEALKQSLINEHQPSTETECILITSMAESNWLAQRAQTLQTTCLDENTGAITNEKTFSLYLRYQTTHSRHFDKALNQFLKLRSERRKAELGFEAQKHKEALQHMKIEDQQARQDAFAHEAWQKKMHKDLIARAKLGKLLFDTQMRELKKPGFEAQFNKELTKQGFEPLEAMRFAA